MGCESYGPELFFPFADLVILASWTREVIFIAFFDVWPRLPDLYLSMTLIDLNTSYWEESKGGVAEIHLMKDHLVVWMLLFVDNIKNLNNSLLHVR